MQFFGLVLVAVLISTVTTERSIAFGNRIDGDQVVAVQHRASEFFLKPTNYTYVFDYKGDGHIFNITRFHIDLQANSYGSGITIKDGGIVGGIGKTFLQLIVEETDVLYVNSVMRIYGFK